MDEEADIVRGVAAEIVARHGIRAAAVAIRHEEEARAHGHHTDADAWLNMVTAAVEILRGKPFLELLGFRRR